MCEYITEILLASTGTVSMYITSSLHLKCVFLKWLKPLDVVAWRLSLFLWTSVTSERLVLNSLKKVRSFRRKKDVNILGSKEVARNVCTWAGVHDGDDNDVMQHGSHTQANWHLSKQVICWPVSLDHNYSGLEFRAHQGHMYFFKYTTDQVLVFD